MCVCMCTTVCMGEVCVWLCVLAMCMCTIVCLGEVCVYGAVCMGEVCVCLWLCVWAVCMGCDYRQCVYGFVSECGLQIYLHLEERATSCSLMCSVIDTQSHIHVRTHTHTNTHARIHTPTHTYPHMHIYTIDIVKGFFFQLNICILVYTQYTLIQIYTHTHAIISTDPYTICDTL